MRFIYLLMPIGTMLLITILELYQRHQIYLLNSKVNTLRILQKEKMLYKMKKSELLAPERIHSFVENKLPLKKSSSNQVIIVSSSISSEVKNQ